VTFQLLHIFAHLKSQRPTAHGETRVLTCSIYVPWSCLLVEHGHSTPVSTLEWFSVFTCRNVGNAER